METRRWFKNKDFTKLEIRECTPKTHSTATNIVSIDDTDVIKNLVERIEKIPTDGGLMVSWGGDASILELTFKSERGDQLIEIYAGAFKTPSTGFNFNDTDAEKELCEDIRKLLKQYYN